LSIFFTLQGPEVEWGDAESLFKEGPYGDFVVNISDDSDATVVLIVELARPCVEL
jgi:hypothetical protein